MIFAILKSLDQVLKTLIKVGDAIAGKVGEALAKAARESMYKELGVELERIQALSLVNENIRDEEIQFLEERIQLLQDYMDRTMVRLDGVRVIVCK